MFVFPHSKTSWKLVSRLVAIGDPTQNTYALIDEEGRYFHPSIEKVEVKSSVRFFIDNRPQPNEREAVLEATLLGCRTINHIYPPVQRGR